ncbi:hypothetical protein OHB00_01290 [Streptomyces sp. NBC_00631]|uniref:hypothetical protein n=1 Tax=Streptomyces sp. NBC_00631 TaxID=2975793 RepID=UPI0030E16211
MPAEADAEASQAPAGPEIIAPRRPAQADLTGPGTTDEVVDMLVEQTEDQAHDVVAALLAQARGEGRTRDPDAAPYKGTGRARRHP